MAIYDFTIGIICDVTFYHFCPKTFASSNTATQTIKYDSSTTESIYDWI